MNREKKEYERITILIVRSILAISFSIFAIYKLWNVNIQIEKFDYLYFLSTAIALFAIVLSVLFYFKSTEQSNEFYNNIFNFTKDTSTLLAEMKAGIGNLENELYRSHEKTYEDKIKNEKELQKEGKKISEEHNKIDNNISKILGDNITDKDQVTELKKKLLQQSRELARLEFEKEKVDIELEDLKNGNINKIEKDLFDFLLFIIRNNNGLTKDDLRLLRPIELKRYVNNFSVKTSNRDYLIDAQKVGLINENKRITDIGLEKLCNYIRKIV